VKVMRQNTRRVPASSLIFFRDSDICSLRRNQPCSMSDRAEEISEILGSPSRNISFCVVIELQVLDGLLSFRQLMVPAGLTDRIAHVN